MAADVQADVKARVKLRMPQAEEDFREAVKSYGLQRAISHQAYRFEDAEVYDYYVRRTVEERKAAKSRAAYRNLLDIARKGVRNVHSDMAAGKGFRGAYNKTVIKAQAAAYRDLREVVYLLAKELNVELKIDLSSD